MRFVKLSISAFSGVRLLSRIVAPATRLERARVSPSGVTVLLLKDDVLLPELVLDSGIAG